MTLDDLERRIRTLLQKRCVFRSPSQKFEDRPILSAGKIKAYFFAANDSGFWNREVYADIRGGFSRRGHQTTVELSIMVIFSVSRWLLLRKL